MAMTVRWLEKAQRDLAAIFNFVEIESDQKTAENLVRTLVKRTKQLAVFPKSGPVEKLLNQSEFEYRYLVEGNFKVIYRALGDVIFIDTVFDTRQNPELLTDSLDAG